MTESAPAALSLRQAPWWLVRGIAVGGVLGGAYGSFVPLFGTLVGGVIGLGAGVLLGATMTVSAAVTRLAIPASPQGIDRRERVLCAIAIVAGVVLASVSTEPRHRPLLLFLPGALGVVHALAAGPPTRDALWSGRVGPRRRAVCLALPAVVLSGALALFVGVLALSAWSARSR